jgi:RsiW-degrading membrane proteinase PrsW (M82 family)
MKGTLAGIVERLEPFEDCFFKWLLRLAVAAVLVGSAWIDDAPPLELGAMIVALYAAVRVALQSGAFYSAAPFRNPALKVLVVVIALGLLALTFVTVAIFVETLSSAAVELGSKNPEPATSA